MNIQPLEDRVLIEPISKEDLPAGQAGSTKSGIVLPDTLDKEKPEQGKVIAIGSGKLVKVGDVVLFTKYGPQEIKIDNKEYLIAKEEDILAILNL